MALHGSEDVLVPRSGRRKLFILYYALGMAAPLQRRGGPLKRRVYTVGHSSRGLGELVQLLRRYGVAVVADVRRRPGSRRVPWFSRGVLEEELPRRGIGYVWLGRLLGGFRRGGYEAYMRTPSYWRGIAVLTRVILESPGPVALMCRERVWRRCHRRYIAETLACMGYEVVHIIDLGLAERHRPGGCEGERGLTPPPGA